MRAVQRLRCVNETATAGNGEPLTPRVGVVVNRDEDDRNGKKATATVMWHGYRREDGPSKGVCATRTRCGGRACIRANNGAGPGIGVSKPCKKTELFVWRRPG